MKKLKFIPVVMLISLFSFTSCQDEVDIEQGQNPNTNSANSMTANNIKRLSMYDGSFDDFLDGNSCSSILLPVIATVNGQQISIVSQSDYQTAINILGEFNNDNDTVTLQFPLSVRLSNYSEVTVANQMEYDAIVNACEQAETNGQNAISCVEINYPITILTYNLEADQTGSVVIESEEQLFNFMDNFGNDELFAIDYPITLESQGSNSVTIDSDAELQSSINDCLEQEGIEQEAEESALEVEAILVDGLFKVDSFVNAGVNTATEYGEYTINFANDFTCTAENIVNATIQDVEGAYEVTSQTEVFVNIMFSSNATFELLNGTWEVTSYSNTSLSLRSTTNATTTLVLTQI